jgi:hypothetical protein
MADRFAAEDEAALLEELRRSRDFPDEAVPERLFGLLRGADSRMVRESALETLRRLPDVEVVREAYGLLSAEELFLRQAGIEILSAHPGGLEAIVRAVAHPDKHVRKLALDALFLKGDPSLAPAIASALEDEDENNVIAAVEYLGELGASEFAPPVTAILENARDPFLIVSCLESLARIGGEEATRVVRAKFSDAGAISPVILFPWLRFLAAFPRREDLPVLLVLARDPSVRAGRELLDVFAALLERSPGEGDRLLIRDGLLALADRDLSPSDLYETVLLLANLDAPMEWGFLGGLLEHPEPMLRAAALEAVSLRGLSAFRPAVERLAGDEDPEVAGLAREILSTSSEPS